LLPKSHMFKHGYNLLTPIKRLSTRILRPVNIFLGASGALCFLFTAKTIYLDSQPFYSSAGGTRDSHHLLSSLKRRKSTDNFDHRRPIDIDTKLREHEESYTTNISTGISRFDIVQVSR
jgi:hypothetical protein